MPYLARNDGIPGLTTGRLQPNREDPGGLDELELQGDDRASRRLGEGLMGQTIRVQNAGPDIVATNYWETDLPGRGLVYVSVNARCFRILMPDEFPLDDLRLARMVVVSRGPWPSEALPDAVEILFDDGTASPFALHVSPGQIDRLPPPADSGRADLTRAIWTSGPNGPAKALSFPAGYRTVARIPSLAPWETVD